ncbi:Uncharacterised protein [Mycobacterium tuberculosis]|nr:Uncharacterised protein [Mycobacterium tuberculosis]
MSARCRPTRRQPGQPQRLGWPVRPRWWSAAVQQMASPGSPPTTSRHSHTSRLRLAPTFPHSGLRRPRSHRCSDRKCWSPPTPPARRGWPRRPAAAPWLQTLPRRPPLPRWPGRPLPERAPPWPTSTPHTVRPQPPWSPTTVPTTRRSEPRSPSHSRPPWTVIRWPARPRPLPRPASDPTRDRHTCARN